MKTSVLAFTLASVLVGCGSDNGDNTDTELESVSTLTGVFVDSAVAGISYKTTTKKGTTNELGEYDYVEGETVTFFLNGLEFPPVLAKGIVTPLDMSDDSVTQTNVLQILQTLDSDGNPENGISIDETTATGFDGSGLDVTSASFDTDVASKLTDLGLTLVSEADAQEHFKGTLLGSWVLSEGISKRNVLTFFGTNNYIIIHEHSDNEEQHEGTVEYGTYSWDLDTGSFSVSPIGESDGSGGLSDLGDSTTITVDQDDLNFTALEGGTFTFTRITSEDNALIGAWSMYETDSDNWNILTFISDSEYIIAHTNNQEDYSYQVNMSYSGEFGRYTLSDDKSFTVISASVDTDGAGGLFNDEDPSDQESETITVHPWGDLTFVDQDEGSYSFARVGRFTATLKVNVLETSGATILLNDLGDITVTRSTGFDALLDADNECSFAVTTSNEGQSIDYNNFSLNLATNTISYDEGDSETIVWEVDSSGTLVVKEGSERESHFVNIMGPSNAVIASIDSDIVDATEETLIEATLSCSLL